MDNNSNIKLGAYPGEGWVHIFLSHFLTAAFAIHLGARMVGQELSMFAVATLGWASVLSIGIVICYLLLLLIVTHRMIKTGDFHSPPFFMLKISENKQIKDKPE